MLTETTAMRRPPAALRSLDDPAVAASSVAAVLLVAGLAPITGGIDAILTRIPDDAFYYIVLAKTFLATGIWSFDRIHAATGFHLLFAYLLAAIQAPLPGLGLPALYAIIVSINSALIGVSVYLLLRVVKEAGLQAGLTGVVLVGLSPAAIRMATYPMECGLTILFGCLAFFMASRSRARDLPAAVPFLIGCVGVLARSDFGALPFALLTGAMLAMVLNRTLDQPLLRRLLVMCAGAVAGVTLVMGHNYAFTGGLVQRSASIKLHWAMTTGPTVLPGLARILELSAPFIVPRALTALGLAAVIGFLAWRGRLGALIRVPFVPASLIVLTGYTVLYAFNGVVQYWYAASFFAAVALLMAAVWAQSGMTSRTARCAVIAVFAASGAVQQATPAWRWQVASREAGEFLRQNPAMAPVASWNAGATGYFAARPVINLDGLVNDSVYPYVTTGRLAAYVAEQKIAYIVDFTSVLDKEGGRRGGYADGILAGCLTPVRAFGGADTFNGHSYTLMSVDQACLARGRNY